MAWGIGRKPLDAITQEVVISLRDEPRRWRFNWRWAGRVLCSSFHRDDGLSVRRKQSVNSPWPIRSVTVELGGEYVAHGRDLKAIWRAGEDWLAHHQKATSADVVKRFLSKAR